MNFGFDIDGTITAAPEAFKVLMSALRKAGHRVYVLTGTMDPVATPDHYVQRHEQLTQAGVAGLYSHLHIVVAPHPQAKADYCRLHHIEFMFEDSPSYADAIKKVCTTVLMQ